MKTSSPASAEHSPAAQDSFFAQANAAMLRAARQVAAENKRLGLPLIAEKPKRAVTVSKH